MSSDVLVGGVQLLEGDRLEPCADLLDVAKFEMQNPPFNVVFWRMATEDRVVHRSPLWQIEGMFADQHFNEILHAWHLGPLLQYIPLVLRFIINSNVLVPRLTHSMLIDCKRLNLLRLKSELWLFYKARRSDPEWKRRHSEVWNLTEKMVLKKRLEISVKAAEAEGLLKFCEYLLQKLEAARNVGLLIAFKL